MLMIKPNDNQTIPFLQPDGDVSMFDKKFSPLTLHPFCNF